LLEGHAMHEIRRADLRRQGGIEVCGLCGIGSMRAAGEDRQARDQRRRLPGSRPDLHAQAPSGSLEKPAFGRFSDIIVVAAGKRRDFCRAGSCPSLAEVVALPRHRLQSAVSLTPLLTKTILPNNLVALAFAVPR